VIYKTFKNKSGFPEKWLSISIKKKLNFEMMTLGLFSKKLECNLNEVERDD